MAKLTPEEKAYYASHVPSKTPPPPATLPPPPGVPGASPNVKGLLIGIGVIVGVIALFGILNNMSGGGGGGSPQFTGFYVDSGLSAGGRWVVTVSVTNSGSETGSPSCDLVALDGDGVALAADVVELDPIAPGESATTRVLTGLKPGENLVASWSVDCS